MFFDTRKLIPVRSCDAMPWWDTVKLSCEACLLLFHVSVLWCVLKEKRSKNVEFSSPFYTFFILQSVFDILFVMAVGYVNNQEPRAK